MTLPVLLSLHAIGWVHRDISSGNVLVLDGPAPIVKLADFEYAKEIGETTGGKHEIRTVSKTIELRGKQLTGSNRARLTLCLSRSLLRTIPLLKVNHNG